MNLADNLKKIRKDNNLSQEQLAEKLNVSRQAVSKWESGLSYPEMDKVIQICNLFNLNINELINENIREVNEIKESQNRTNKYISSFFDYITKVVDMFSSMKFVQILKCLFEQFIVFFILLILYFVVGMVGEFILDSLLTLIPYAVRWGILNIVGSLYTAVYWIIAVVVILHIFKIRYLDYYVFVKEEKEQIEEVVTEVEAVKNTEDNKKSKIVLEKKKEQVIIRDPKHSEYRFFTALGKCMLFGIKCFAAMFLVCFIFSLIGFALILPITFIIFKTGILFIGVLLSLIGCIALNIVILELIYNFIVNKKCNKFRIFLMSIVSLIGIGVGIGCTLIGILNFEIVEEEVEYKETELIYNINDNTIIDLYGIGDIEYIEENRSDIKVIVNHPIIEEVYTVHYDNHYFINIDANERETMTLIKDCIKELNNKKVISYYGNATIKVYGNKTNLDKLKNNYEDYHNELDILYERNNNLLAEKDRLENNNDNLESILNEEGYFVYYDEEGYYSYYEYDNEKEIE